MSQYTISCPIPNSHVIGAQEPDQAVVGFGRVLQVVRDQVIFGVKHLQRGSRTAAREPVPRQNRTDKYLGRPVDESGHLGPH